MRKKIKLWYAVTLTVWTGLISHAATVVGFDFDKPNSAADEAGICAPVVKNLSGVSVSDIAYLQGKKADPSTPSSPVYFSGSPDEKLFAVSSLNLGPSVSAYTEDATRLVFSVEVTGSSADFSKAMLLSDLNAITPPGEKNIYRTNARLACRIDEGAWLTLDQKRMDTGKEASEPLTTELLRSSDGRPYFKKLTGEKETLIFKSDFAWTLSELGSIQKGSRIEFAILLYDQRDAMSYCTLLDNIRISGIVCESAAEEREVSEIERTPIEIGQAESRKSGEGADEIVFADNRTIKVRYSSPDYKARQVLFPEPVILPDGVVRLSAWFGSEEGDASLRFLVKDGGGTVHTVETTDSRMDGPIIQHDKTRNNEWSFWNRATSVSLHMPSEAELKGRLTEADSSRILKQLWPKPLTLTGVEVVPQQPGDRWAGLYSLPQKRAVEAGTGTFWLKFPEWSEQFPRDAEFYALIRERYRPVQDGNVIFFPDDFTLLDQTDIRYRLEVYDGYNGPVIWSGAGTVAVNRSNPAQLFEQRIELPQLPAGKYFVDAKTWTKDDVFSGMRRFTVLVGESRAGMPSAPLSTFSLTTGYPREVCPAGTKSVDLKLVCNKSGVDVDGEFRFRVLDYTGAVVTEQTVSVASGQTAVPVALTAGTDYFGEVERVVAGTVTDRASCHFGAASSSSGVPQGMIPDSIPTMDEFLTGKAWVMAEYFEPNHMSMVYPYTQTFDFSDFGKWAKQVKDLGPQTVVSIKPGWPNIEPLPGVFRWGIFDRELAVLREHGLKIFFGYAPYGGGDMVPRWLNVIPFRNQFGDFVAKNGLVHPLAPPVQTGWHNYLRQLITRYYTDEDIYGYTVFNTPFYGSLIPEPFITDYSQTAQDEFNKWLAQQGRSSARLTPLLVIPDMKTEDQGSDLSSGWRDFVDFCSYTTYENTRAVLELVRGLDPKRQIFVDRKSNPYAVERIIPLLEQYNAAFKNEGSPGFREAMLRSMTAQAGVPFVEELHRHVPTSRSVADASNYFASYLGKGALWLARWSGAMLEPDYDHPIHSLFLPNYPFLKSTQKNWNEYLSGSYYEPEVLVVGSRINELINGQRRGFFDDISGKLVYSTLFEWQQVPVHFADEHCDWVDFSTFKLIFVDGEVMSQQLIDRLTAAAASGVKMIVIGEAGTMAAGQPGSTGVLKNRLSGLGNVKYQDPPPRINGNTAWDAPANWKKSEVDAWLKWAGVARPVYVTAEKQPGFQVQYRTAPDGTIYLAVMRNYYGWYRNNIEFEDDLLKKYGKVAGKVMLPVSGGTWVVDKFHRDSKTIGEFTEANGTIKFPIDPAVAGEVQLIRIRKK